MLIIGVDTGGTFTDFIWQDGTRQGEHKRLSTPHNPAVAVLAGLREVAGDRPFQLVHGSTVATNALLERKGARTALVTNRGFEDIIEIARQNRPELYDLQVKKIPPLVPGEHRFGIPGRVDHDGCIIEAVSEAEIALLMEEMSRQQIESIAVSLLFSFNNPAHELLVEKVLEPLGLPISLSHQTLAEFREYERTSTTLINAYVAPRMDSYLGELAREAGAESFRIMQSNGGSISAATARRESVRTILSGPAGGAVGAAAIGQQSGEEKLITFDMGGTSTDVSLIDGQLPLTTESSIAGYPVRVPMIDIHTVGAGGGSVAHLDRGGSLQVGPESAGADPGPICYGKGEQLTVTDANLYLGRLIPEHFLGGGMPLEVGKVRRKMESFAAELGLPPLEAAAGILAVANATMERAIKTISVERGFDPREFCLLSFGGAGGMHAVELAGLLQIPRVLIPTSPGILSAYGMLQADVIKDYSQTVMLSQAETDFQQLTRRLDPLNVQAHAELAAEGVSVGQILLKPMLDMRYVGQSFELLVDLEEDFTAAFHRRHRQVYGYCNEQNRVEIVNLRLRAFGRPERRPMTDWTPGAVAPPAEARLGTREAFFHGISYSTPVFERSRLHSGNHIAGPAILVEYSSTIVLPPGWLLQVDRHGHLLMEMQGGRS